MDTKTTPLVAAAAGKPQKFSNRIGRGVPEIKEQFTKKCSCRRDKTIVFCRACGYYCNGRIRLLCEIHPRIIQGVTWLRRFTHCHAPRCVNASSNVACYISPGYCRMPTMPFFFVHG